MGRRVLSSPPGSDKEMEMASEAEILEENRRVRRLKVVVDLVTAVLWFR
jgi:hypothetical protein